MIFMARTEEYDCAVVGSSLAAYQAIMRLSAAGLTLVWSPSPYDNGDLYSTFVLESDVGGLDSRRLSDAAHTAIARRGRSLSPQNAMDRIVATAAGWDLLLGLRHVASSKALVFAPYGAEVGFDDLRLDRTLLNVFASLEASSNVSVVAGLNLLVYGKGYRALEHAVWLTTGSPRHVMLALEDDVSQWRGTRLWNAARRSGSMNVIEHCIGLEIALALPGHPRSIRVVSKNGEHVVGDLDHLFVARRLVSAWDRLVGSDGVDAERGQRLCFPAGIAAGVWYHEHGQLLRSGEFAAERVLAAIKPASGRRM